MLRDAVTPAERLNPPRDKRAAALHYLRTQSRRGYCLDVKVDRLPVRERAEPTVLDRWMQRRPA